MTTTNDAAERLDPNGEPYPQWLTDLLAAERRATMERIREAIRRTDATFQVTADELAAILDEEAAR